MMMFVVVVVVAAAVAAAAAVAFVRAPRYHVYNETIEVSESENAGCVVDF